MWPSVFPLRCRARLSCRLGSDLDKGREGDRDVLVQDRNDPIVSSDTPPAKRIVVRVPATPSTLLGYCCAMRCQISGASDHQLAVESKVADDEGTWSERPVDDFRRRR